ncbi:MAG: fatty acid desaturase [Bacteroidota bacterium]
MTPSKDYLQQYQFKTAYPTIVLTIMAIAGYGVVSAARAQGYLDVGWTIGINAMLAYVLFTSMHEAAHLNISGGNPALKWVDEAIGWLSGIPLIAPFYLFKVVHFRHHAFTNDPEKDPDHWLASKNWLALLFHSTTIFPVYLFKGIQLFFFGKKISKKIKRELLVSFIGLFFIIFLFVALGLAFGWALILQIWIIPAFIAQVFLAISFDWLPHHPHEEKDRYLNTRIIDIPGLSIFLLGQNYHLVHHLYPRIPFYDYKKVYGELEEEFKENGVEIISVKGNVNIEN